VRKVCSQVAYACGVARCECVRSCSAYGQVRRGCARRGVKPQVGGTGVAGAGRQGVRRRVAGRRQWGGVVVAGGRVSVARWVRVRCGK